MFGKAVRVEFENKDRFGRTVGRVFAGDVAVNVETVWRGFAWWYLTYAKKAVDLATAETEAKNAGRGFVGGQGSGAAMGVPSKHNLFGSYTTLSQADPQGTPSTRSRISVPCVRTATRCCIAGLLHSESTS